MIDREKVINVLTNYKSHAFGDKDEKVTVKEIIALLKAQEQKCRECGEATSKAIQELQAKLKEQEPVKLVVDIDTWKCGNCGHALEHQQLLGDNVLFHEQYNYCPECGRAVKWK